MGAEFGKFALIGGGVIIAVIILATVVKLIEVRRAASWTATRGRILAAAVETRSVKGANSTPRTGNFARIEYEYRVGHKRLRGRRVSIGEEAPDFLVAETMARYPVGAEIEVYYNPEKPEEAVLERELPADFSKGLSIALLYFGGGTIAVFLYFTRGIDWLSSRLPAGSNVLFAATVGALGAFAAAIAWAVQRQAAAARDWIPVDGEIVGATTESYTASSVSWDETQRKIHVPRITYRYVHDNVEYRGDRVDFGGAVGFSSLMMARARSKRFAPGRAVLVLVNPKNPAEATLEARAGNVWILWAVAAGLLALAWLAAQPAA